MARLVLTKRLFRLRGNTGGSADSHDPGYAVHCALSEVFGRRTLLPFSVSRTNPGGIEVLAYSSHPDAELLRRLDTTTSELRSCVERDSIRTKRMPQAFPGGMRLQFRIRACPVIRKSRGSTSRRPHAEIDAFLAELERSGGKPVPDRRIVYCEWLKAHFARSGAAHCREVRLVAMRLGRVYRRDRQGRFVRLGLRPDVTFQGTLEVRDPDAFRRVVRHGIGRHRAFGFGMLLLRPWR